MIIHIETAPHIGARYTAKDSTVFQITKLPIVNNDEWVEYINTHTHQKYNCKLEAFLARFTPTV